jgi:hypothetical protein
MLCIFASLNLIFGHSDTTQVSCGFALHAVVIGIERLTSGVNRDVQFYYQG